MSFYRPGGSGSGSVTTTPVSVAEGGTGATTAAGARSNLGITATGSDTNYAFRSNNLSDLNSASSARTNLGLGSIATQAASNVSISGGSIVGITDLAVADGGTGSSTAAGALANLLPSYTSNSNKVLSVKSDASGVEWTTNGAGTVTSIDMSVPTGLAISGNPITSSGTLAVSFASGYSIPTTTKQGNWDTAYGWGDHAAAGYAKYSDTTANFTGTLQKSGSNVLVATDIGTSVQAYDADTTKNDVVNTFTTNQIISTNTSSDALRITQTGAGNALVVEDSANPDSTPFVVDAGGFVGIHGTPTTGTNSLYIGSTLTGTTSTSVNNNSVFATGVTTGRVYNTFISVPGTLNQLVHYRAQQNAFSGTVTNQYGFVAENGLNGATNNYGFYSNIASASGRFNFYANGTAVNYFAGNVGIGSGKTAPSTELDVNGTVTATAFEGTISGGTYA